MKLKLLKLIRLFHLIDKEKYNEKRQIEIVKKSPLFDRKWYLAQNPDVKSKKMGAAKHYVKKGWKEGRNPSQEFDGNEYLAEFPELREKNWCPLFHYMLQNPHLLPKTSLLEEILNKIDKITNRYNGKSKDYILIAKSKYFNKRWYLKTYPDVKKSGMDPIEHYLKYGWKDGRNPSKLFNGEEYFNIYEDVKKAKINPLLHYEKFGKKENRLHQVKKDVPISMFVIKFFDFMQLFRKSNDVKRVLLISHEFTYTGAPLSLLKAAQCLSEMGYELKILSLKDGELRKEFSKYGKVIISKNFNKDILFASDCDFVIVNTLVCYCEYSIFFNLLPTVWWIREPSSMLDRYRYKYIEPILRDAQNLYTMSEYSRSEFLKYNSDIKVIKHGFDDEYRDKQIDVNKLAFAVIGSVDIRKGQDVLADAIRMIPIEKRRKAKFYIVGQQHNKKYCDALCKDIEDVLQFIEPISNLKDMISFYENISCAVIPSREEPTSRIAIEAMMMGRPVIMSNKVGAQYLLEEGKNGYMFENENSEQLARIIEDIIDNPDKLKNMSEEARKAYLQNNSIEVYKHNLKNMINNVFMSEKKEVKILVHLHLYYHDQLDYFIKKLKNITGNYDLYVTVVNLEEKVVEKLKQFKSDVKILKVANRGYDIWPFWNILQQVNLDDYFAVLKIHTKNCRDTIWMKEGIPYTGFDWRNDLIDPLIGNKFLFRNCINKLKKSNCGMVYSKNLERTIENDTQKEITKKLCTLFKYDYFKSPFACGTMFLIKSNCLSDFKNYKFMEGDFSAISLTGSVGTLAHSIETFFGIIVVNKGMYSIGVHNIRTKIKDLKRKFNKLFKKRTKRYSNDVTYIKKSQYFNKKWYLKEYPDVKNAKVDPAKHYMKHGWKEGRNPSLYFNTKWYLERYKDVKNANINPLLHYERNGKYEGRSASNTNLKPLNIFNYPMWLKRQVNILSHKKDCKNNLPIIVSLTTYPARIYAVIETINSIFRQTHQPDKIILWLTYEEFPKQEKELPKELLELKKNGLLIGWCHNLRSYNKLLPSLKKYPNALHITVDDDIIYKPTLIEKLYESYLKYPKDIHCHRITKFYYNGGYKTSVGGREYYENGSFLNKLTGVGGVLYPVGCFYKDIFNVDLIKKLAPTNDDQWFWFQSVLNGVKTRVVDDADPTLDYVEGSQETGLYLENDNGANLFWRDFKCLMEYYPQVDKIFKKELKRRKNEKFFDVISSYILLPYNYLFYVNYEIKQKRLPAKNYKYYSELSPDLYPIELKEWYKKMTGYELNLDNPKTFNEKIQWLKLYDSTPKKTKLADKYLVRKWVKSQIGEKYLISLLGVYDKFEDINFDKLPERFVIKCNHGSGWNIIVKDKSKLNLKDVKQKLDSWMNTNFAFQFGFELHYRDMKPKIIIEEFVSNDCQVLYDYKFWCFNGEVKYMQFRDDFSSNLKMVFYDMDWNKQYFYYDHPLYDEELEKPYNLYEMKRIATKLCKGFSFVCVDLYRLNDGKIKFGEMTFTRSSGIGKWNDDKINQKLGDLIKLPNTKYNLFTKQYEILKKTKKKRKQ